MHDTQQLLKCGLIDEDISALFLGVFPADQIPLFFPTRDWCLIANTDPAGKDGQHWIAMGFKWRQNFFFDSYGNKPSFYQECWKRFDKWRRWDKDVQQLTSDVCGDWCLYWCSGFARVLTENKLSRFLNKFCDNKMENDSHVVRVIHSKFPRIMNTTKHSNRLDVILREKLDSIAYPQCLSCNQVCTYRRKLI